MRSSNPLRHLSKLTTADSVVPIFTAEFFKVQVKNGANYVKFTYFFKSVIFWSNGSQHYSILITSYEGLVARHIPQSNTVRTS